MADEPKKSRGIPTSKVQRAARFVKTGAKVGRNYAKHYARKAVNPNADREQLDRDNARDVYDTLSDLKGSALKMAQMMSMQEGVLPDAYAQQFQKAQYEAPALSYPLIVKTFRTQLGKSPEALFDSFSHEAKHAASIGQVHEAEKDGKRLAVKVQYPGVATSIRSDLHMVKPFALQLLNLNEKEIDLFMGEVEEMMIAETDYLGELERGERIAQACAGLENLFFPTYHRELSSERILTMDFLPGVHLSAFSEMQPSQEVRDKIGQALWDFYDFQMHELREVHADPHPGNFLLTEDGKVGVIDFGAVKTIPEEYYRLHFQAIDRELLEDDEARINFFYEVGFLHEEDTPEERDQFADVFTRMMELTTVPFATDTFNFGDKEYFDKLTAFGEETSQSEVFRNSTKARGSRHALYLNRAYFGLYYLLHALEANVHTYTRWKPEN